MQEVHISFQILPKMSILIFKLMKIKIIVILLSAMVNLKLIAYLLVIEISFNFNNLSI